MMLEKCPHCNKDLISMVDPRTSKMLIIGDKPGLSEVQKGIPFISNTGTVLRNELASVGLDLSQFRRTLLWLHAETLGKDGEECLKYGIEQAINNAKGMKVILLLGSAPVKQFVGKNVSDVAGLKVTSPYLSAPLIVASYSPAIVFSGMLGEFRLALKKLEQYIMEIK